MRIPRVARIVLACIAVVLAGGALWVWVVRPSIVAYGTALHQKNVTRELAEWGEEYSVVKDDASAVRAAEIVVYMSWYYVPSSGYRGPADVEAALEAQRRKSIARVVASLEQYTGLRFGANPKRWEQWAQEQKKRSSVEDGSRPADRANDDMPIRAQ
jgi:hypothetical protein